MMNRKSKTHSIKIHQDEFDAVLRGDKTFEYRLNDRDYKVGDILHLCGCSPSPETFTGHEKDFEVTYCLYGGKYGVPEGYVVMSIVPRLLF